MNLRRLIAGAVLIFLVACGKPSNSSEVKNVFGGDNRVQMTSTQYPWSTIGRLVNPNGSCTGSMVGENLVLTNAHCVFDGNGDLHSWVKFTLGAGTPNPANTVYANHVWWGTKIPQSARTKDWAILRLSTKPGRGFLGTINKGSFNPIGDTNLILAGYSGDYWRENGTAGVHLGCSITKEESGYYLHNCDMTGGSSGGPLFVKFTDRPGHYIVGLNAAQRYCNAQSQTVCQNGVSYSHSRANIAVKVEGFGKKIAELREAKNKDGIRPMANNEADFAKLAD